MLLPNQKHFPVGKHFETLMQIRVLRVDELMSSDHQRLGSDVESPIFVFEICTDFGVYLRKAMGAVHPVIVEEIRLERTVVKEQTNNRRKRENKYIWIYI